MTTYRVGTHHGVTINREGDGHRCDRPGHDCARGHLVGVMLTAEDAALVVEALNGRAHRGHNHSAGLDGYCEDQAEPPAGPWTVPVDHAYVGDGPTCSQCTRSRALHEAYWAGPPDSCTCPVPYRSSTAPDPWCPVHQGRRARGPKPPPLGPGCICDGSGRTCPRHGAVM